MSLDVLIIDDENDICDLISDIIKDEGYNPTIANNSKDAIEAISQRLPKAVILDIWLKNSQLDGLGILELIKKKHHNLPVIMISGHGNIETAISSIKLGAYDYIEKPFNEDKLLLLLKRAIEAAKLQDENNQLKQTGVFESHLIGNSQAVLNLKSTILKLSQANSRVLISGPSGCGKEVIARNIHNNSQRKEFPFVALNCKSISAGQVNKELFGYDDYKDMDSSSQKIGVFEKAHGGTLFVDDVSEMSLDMQARFLKTIQEEGFIRTNSDKFIKVNVRIIASTTRDLAQEIKEGNFREDLYYRLNVFPVKVPALKSRKEDLVPLIDYFLKRCAQLLRLPTRIINEDAVAMMQLYDWPGNVRQLKNIIEKMLIMAPDDIKAAITSDMLPAEIIAENSLTQRPENNADIMGLPLREARAVFEKQYLLAQIDRFGGNISKTACFIGMERSAFHRKLKLLNISKKDMQNANNDYEEES